jgi:uroporphyrinogen decarboxylase
LQDIKPPHLGPILDKVDALVEVATPAHIGVCFVVGGPFSTAYLAMGLVDFMLALYDKPALVNALMDIATDFCHAAVDEACHHNIAFLVIADDMGMDSGLMIRPAMLQELWIPRIRQVLQPAKARGLPVVLHSDGDIRDMLPAIVELGFDAVHPLQPTGKLDIYEVKERFGDRLCLFGNIDVSGVLSFGTPEEVAQDVREHIVRSGYNGGYVCSSSHAILDSVPPENFEAMLSAVHYYGKY